MSYNYNYYLGYEKDGKIYPLGPYDADGKIYSVITKSRSFASDLHEDFYPVKNMQISDKLRSAFEFENCEGDKEMQNVKYLYLKELPKDDFIKSGYFLIEDIQEYIKTNDTSDLFYEHLDPAIYAIKLKNEMALGKPSDKFDEEGNKFDNYSASDYAFFAYPDYNSKEFECFMLRNAVNMLEFSDLLENAKIVILETEG